MPARPLDSLGATGKFTRERRVRRRREYTRIHEAGRRIHTASFTVIACPRADDGSGARLGCAVSRRVGNAVVRNRVRRLLKEIFRRFAAELPAFDLVVIAKPEAAAVGAAGLEAMAAELIPAFARAVRPRDDGGDRRPPRARPRGEKGRR